MEPCLMDSQFTKKRPPFLGVNPQFAQRMFIYVCYISYIYIYVSICDLLPLCIVITQGHRMAMDQTAGAMLLFPPKSQNGSSWWKPKPPHRTGLWSTSSGLLRTLRTLVGTVTTPFHRLLGNWATGQRRTWRRFPARDLVKLEIRVTKRALFQSTRM